MTTVYRDKEGKVLRTDPGTRPAGAPAPKPAHKPRADKPAASSPKHRQEKKS